PVGACVTSPELGDVLERGDHGSTFAGAPIAAAAALAALALIDDAELLRRTRELGAAFMERLEGFGGIVDVRGRGLMVGVTLAEGLEAADIAARALAEGLVINVPGPDMLRFLPPLVIDSGDIDEAAQILARVLD